MKKLLLSLSMALVALTSQAQLVSGDFEATISHPYATQGAPEVGTCGANQDWFGIFDAETANPGAGSQSAKMATINSPILNNAFNWGSDTIPGFIQQTVNSYDITGATVNFLYKYTPVNVDTALLLVQILDTMQAGSSDDVVIAGGAADIMSASTWTTGTFTIQSFATGTPHQTVFLATSSVGGFFNTSLPQVGSTLWLDNIAVVAAGVEEKSFSAKVYPNPANDVLNIQVGEEIENVTITSIDGKVINYGNSSSINVASLTPGMYVYTVTTTTGKLAKGNFVKK